MLKLLLQHLRLTLRQPWQLLSQRRPFQLLPLKQPLPEPWLTFRDQTRISSHHGHGHGHCAQNFSHRDHGHCGLSVCRRDHGHYGLSVSHRDPARGDLPCLRVFHRERLHGPSSFRLVYAFFQRVVLQSHAFWLRVFLHGHGVFPHGRCQTRCWRDLGSH